MGFALPPALLNALKYQGDQIAAIPGVNNPRAPTTSDRNYPLFTLWRYSSTVPDSSGNAEGDMWYLAKFTANGTSPALANWVKISNASIPEFIQFLGGTGTTGTFPVQPDGAGNITLASPDSSVVINGALNTLNFTAGGTVPLSFPTDSGTATPVANLLNIRGNNIALNNTGIDVTGAGSTVSVHMSSGYTLSDFTFQNSVAATPRILQVLNQDNDAASNSIMRVAVTGTSNADPFIQVGRSSTYNYCWGIDNSDSGTLKICQDANSNAAVPSGGTLLWKMTTGGAASYVAGNVDVTRGNGSTVSHSIVNTSGVGANALELLQVESTSPGDPQTTYKVNGGSSWSIGTDNSDSDALVISASAALGTTNVIRASTSGEINYPLQPAFLATGAAATDVTGDGTAFVPGSSGTAFTTIFDQNSDFNTNGTFTAPVTGRYAFSGGVQLSGLLSTHISGFFQLISSNRTLTAWTGSPWAVSNNVGGCMISGSFIVDMDAADTATLNISVSGGTKVVDVITNQTRFSGYLIC